MKITIFYFSGTGSTWYVANSLAKALNDRGANADAVTIESKSMDVKELIAQSDKIVIGFPIYCSAAPRNMLQFINDLPPVDKKPISVFTTVALYSGDGTIHYKKVLEEKGYTFETGMEFVMHSNSDIPGMGGIFKTGDAEKIAKRNQRADIKSGKMADFIIQSMHKKEGGGPLGRLTGVIQRKFYDTAINMINDKLMVAHDKCIKCMRCVKMCPTENIKFEDGKIVIGSSCMACVRCYHFCPTGAINITEKSQDMQKWPRFKGPTKDYIKTLL